MMMTEYAEAFCNAFQNVMPQLGIEDINLIDIEEVQGKIQTSEIVCIIGIIGDVKGNVIYAMNEEIAKTIAGTMMGGMELDEFDEIAQSAVSELGNMLSGGACTELSTRQITADVSTPTLMIGKFTVNASTECVTRMRHTVAGDAFDIFLSLEKR